VDRKGLKRLQYSKRQALGLALLQKPSHPFQEKGMIFGRGHKEQEDHTIRGGQPDRKKTKPRMEGVPKKLGRRGTRRSVIRPRNQKTGDGRGGRFGTDKEREEKKRKCGWIRVGLLLEG